MAMLAACLAAAVYFTGVFWLEVAVNESSHGAGSSPSPSCRADAPDGDISRIASYRVSHLPLQFECVLDDGTTYASSEFPGSLTAFPAILAVSAALLTASARSDQPIRHRTHSPNRQFDP
ncbi:hypothetical protein [Streptomyces apocyni]|uniref:hypothetical protein n=1 Tax=Streptomyces apocyni TaxID=2654677 RepID=UPI0012E9F9D7|nr:hypothetical protein [Streptomyces apocyni]